MLTGSYNVVDIMVDRNLPICGTWTMCSTTIGGGPFSYKLPPKLAISRNMAGIRIITQP